MPEYDSTVTTYNGYINLDGGIGGECFVQMTMRSDFGWTDEVWQALSSAVNAAVLAHLPTTNLPGTNAPVVPSFDFSSNLQTQANKVYAVDGSTGALSYTP